MKKLQLTTEWEDISPKTAKEYLTRNVANRSLREKTVAAYAIDMKSGNWVATHQGIAFNDNGDLIDGQHRLAAIVRAGVTVRMLVTRGVPRKSGSMQTMDAVDRGASRSVADQLRVQHGYRNPARDVACSTAIVHMCCMSSGSRRVSVPQVLKVLEVYGRQITDIASLTERSHDKRLRRSQLVAALAFARQVDPHAVDRFLDGLITGANLAVGSPVLLLRNFLFSDASTNWATSGNKDARVAFSLVVLNSLLQFIEREPSTKLLEGRKGFVHFASQQKANVEKIAAIFFAKPAAMDSSAATATPIASATNAPRYVTAKEFKITPAAEALLRGKDVSDRVNNRVEKMNQRIARGELEGAA